MGTIAQDGTIPAWLAKDGLRILCGKLGTNGSPVCGETLAYLEAFPTAVDEPGLVAFGPGWQGGRDGGVVELTGRASADLKRDLWRATGNPGTSDRQASQAAERLSEGLSVHFRRPAGPSDEPSDVRRSQVEAHLLDRGVESPRLVALKSTRHLQKLYKTPVVARCPRCRLLNHIAVGLFFDSPSARWRP